MSSQPLPASSNAPAPTLGQEILHLREIAAGLLPDYGLSPASVLTLLNESENITFRIDDPKSHAPLVLRIYRHGYHTPEAILSELAWMEALGSSTGILTPRTVSADSGRVLSTLHDSLRDTQRHAVMFTHLSGHEPSGGDLPSTFERLGGLAARMHDHTATWRRPEGFHRPTWDVNTMLAGDQPIWGRWQDGLGLDGESRPLLDRASETLARRLERFGTDPERFGLIHADLRITNLLVEGDTTKVIDFDDCGFGWHLYDLSAALTFIEDQPGSDALETAWLKGYRRHRQLNADEIGEIPTFHLLRRLIIVAWIASHIESETAMSSGAAYTHATCAAARRYIARFA